MIHHMSPLTDTTELSHTVASFREAFAAFREGVDLLDTYQPGWWQFMTRPVVMQDARQCPLGQIYGVYWEGYRDLLLNAARAALPWYARALGLWFNETTYATGPASRHWAYEHGFDAPTPAARGLLAVWWESEATLRRELAPQNDEDRSADTVEEPNNANV